MIFNGTEEQEKEYLQQVIDIINDTINSTDKSVKEHVDTLQEYKDYLWSNKDIDPHEIRSMRESILNHFARGENVIDKRNRLSKILDIPYFGRIDFKENKSDSKNIPIYIGIHTFFDIKSKRNLIYDWRAPISGMFYDYESDEALDGKAFTIPHPKCFMIMSQMRPLILLLQAKCMERFHSNVSIAFVKVRWNT